MKILIILTTSDYIDAMYCNPGLDRAKCEVVPRALFENLPIIDHPSQSYAIKSKLISDTSTTDDLTGRD
jgi:hypothetical protein